MKWIKTHGTEIMAERCTEQKTWQKDAQTRKHGRPTIWGKGMFLRLDSNYDPVCVQPVQSITLGTTAMVCHSSKEGDRVSAGEKEREGETERQTEGGANTTERDRRREKGR